jgi:hypothetical protein
VLQKKNHSVCKMRKSLKEKNMKIGTRQIWQLL